MPVKFGTHENFICHLKKKIFKTQATWPAVFVVRNHAMHVKWNRCNIWYSLNCIVINALIVWLYLYSCWRSNYQEGMVGIPLTDLYSPHFPAKHNNYVVNQKLKHFDDISFRELFDRIRVGFYKWKFVLLKTRYLYLCSAILFYDTKLD